MTLLPVVVESGRGFNGLLEKGNYGQRGRRLHPRTVRIATHTYMCQAGVFTIEGSSLDSQAILRQMREQGFRPAPVEVLLSFGVLHPRLVPSYADRQVLVSLVPALPRYEEDEVTLYPFIARAMNGRLVTGLLTEFLGLDGDAVFLVVK